VRQVDLARPAVVQVREGYLVLGADLLPDDNLVDVCARSVYTEKTREGQVNSRSKDNSTERTVELVPVIVLIEIAEERLELGTSRDRHVQGLGLQGQTRETR